MERGTIHLVSIATIIEGLTDMTWPPSAILYVGGQLKANGYRVKIHHLPKERMEQVIHGGLLERDTLFVGFSVFTGQQVTNSAAMSLRLKQINPDITIVWGGVHPSLMPKECLDFGFLDYVVIGEGENTAVELANFLTLRRLGDPSAIRGIAFRRNGETVITQPRPFGKHLDFFRQDWSLIDVRNYVRLYDGEKGIQFISSRGCPHSCGFCYNEAFNKRLWRGHSPDFVIREVAEIKAQTGITSVDFHDDNFFANPKRALQIIRSLKEQGITCQMVEIRVDNLTKELVAELVHLGVASIFFGWESGSSTTLKKISKGFSPQLILEKTKLLAKFKDLTVCAAAIVGFPWETDVEIGETIALALKMFRIMPFRLNFSVSIYIPYPGSPVLPEAEARGFTFPTDYNRWSDFDLHAGTIEFPWLSSRKLKSLRRIQGYARVLYVNRKGNSWARVVKYAFAALAYARLKTGMLWFPFEVWLRKLALRYRYWLSKKWS